LERSPEEVFELGQQTVAANQDRVIALGMEAYGLEDFVTTIDRITADQSD
jgi:hypothetical protein